jgi:hypothetical protein
MKLFTKYFRTNVAKSNQFISRRSVASTSVAISLLKQKLAQRMQSKKLIKPILVKNTIKSMFHIVISQKESVKLQIK